MRKAGDFNEQKKALRFWNYLKAKGVDSSLEEDGGEWTVWVADEDDLQLATDPDQKPPASQNRARDKRV